MLKRAFGGSTNGPGGNSRRCNSRLCFGFGIAVLLSLGIIVYTWKMVVSGLPPPNGQPNSSPITKLQQQSDSQVNPNEEILLPAPASLSPMNKKHIVEIYYEVLCPDSRYFILKNFNPAYEQLQEYITPIFVPYGKATTSTRGTTITFNCQHGEPECQGNMIHACAIAYLKDELILSKYLGCMINENYNYEGIGEKCAKQLNLNWNPIYDCWKGEEGPKLLKNYGEMTHSLRPKISFIPTVVVDKSQNGQRDMLKNFKSFMCGKILTEEKPQQC